MDIIPDKVVESSDQFFNFSGDKGSFFVIIGCTEEVDFSLRVRKAGFALVSITTSSIIKNKNLDSSQPDVIYYSVRNARLIIKKHPDHFSRVGYLLYLGWIALITLKYIARPQMFYKIVNSYFSGLSDSFRNKYYKRQK